MARDRDIRADSMWLVEGELHQTVQAALKEGGTHADSTRQEEAHQAVQLVAREGDNRGDSTRQEAEAHRMTVHLVVREGDSPADNTWPEVEAHQRGSDGTFRCGRNCATAARNVPRDSAGSRGRDAAAAVNNS